MLVLVPMLGDPCREQRLLVGVRVLVLVAMLGDPCREQRLSVGVRVLVLVAMLGDPCREQRLSVGGSGAGAGGDAAASTRAFTASLDLLGRVAGLCFPERLPSALNPP